MSYQNYKEAMKLAPKCRFYTTAGGRSIAEISRAEDFGEFVLELVKEQIES
ncbi:MAG: hypothetical protein HDR20_12065 [Lachnospiraceae bacterium]|nr:hypothetical protein [Lachnospiraceae bacterium]